jgi:endogenous inhibitor of DNA gyrase (YacG/DUF329 family)
LPDRDSPPANDNAKCPICGKPRVAKYDPFCSKRCADVDLYRWLKGGYVIPGEDEPPPGSEPIDDGE